MRFLFRLDLSLHAGAGKKFEILIFASKHGQEGFPSNSDQKVRTCQLAAHNRIYLGLRSQAAAATTGPASARAPKAIPSHPQATTSTRSAGAHRNGVVASEFSTTIPPRADGPAETVKRARVVSRGGNGSRF